MKFFSRLALSSLVASTLVVGPVEGALANACVASGGFAGGDGSAGNPFQISTPGELQHMANALNGTLGTADAGLVNSRIVLTNDIDMGGCVYSPQLAGVPFRGQFDGQNHAISNLVISRASFTSVGLFSTSANGAEISNVRFISPSVLGNSRVGVVVGEGLATELRNITVVDATVTGGGFSVGGIAGSLGSQFGKLTENLVVTGSTVSGDNFVGGLFGLATVFYLHQAAFSDGRVLQNVESSGYAGGLIGFFGSATLTSRESVTVSRSSFTGRVEVTHGNSAYSGLLFGNVRNLAVTVTDSYARGDVRTSVANFAPSAVGRLDASDFGSSVSVDRVYVQGSYYRYNNLQVLSNAWPVAPSVLASTDSFYGAETHTQWLATTGATAKTSAELADPATYAAPWSVTQDADAVRAQSAPAEVWFINDQINSGLPVHVWAYRAGVHAVECPVGRYSVDGLAPCVLASPGSFVATTGATAQQACPAGETSDAGAASCYVPASQDFAYRGPLVSGVSSDLAAGAAGVSVGERVVITGSRLGQVSSVSISGVSSVAVCSETSCEFVVPEGVSAGLQDLLLLGSHGVLTIQDGIRINLTANALPDGLRVWTRDQGDGTVKVYARGVVGVGKVQFFVNGREVAWVRATDSSDPKLRTPSAGPMAGVSYLVRSVPLVAGRNVIEVHVSGERVLRRVASGG